MTLRRNGSNVAEHLLRPENNIRGVDLVWIEELSWDAFLHGVAVRNEVHDKDEHRRKCRSETGGTLRNKSRSQSSGVVVTHVPLPFDCSSGEDGKGVNVLTKLRAMERAAVLQLRRRRGCNEANGNASESLDDESESAHRLAERGDEHHRGSGLPVAPRGHQAFQQSVTLATRTCALAEDDDEEAGPPEDFDSQRGSGKFEYRRMPSASAASSASLFLGASTREQRESATCASIRDVPRLEVFRAARGSDDISQSLTLHSHSMSSSSCSTRLSELPGDIQGLYGPPSLPGLAQAPPFSATAAPQLRWPAGDALQPLLQQEIVSSCAPPCPLVEEEGGTTPPRGLVQQQPSLRGTATSTALERTTLSMSTSTGVARSTVDSRQTLALGPLVAAAAPHYPNLIECSTVVISQDATTPDDALSPPAAEVRLAPHAAAIHHNWDAAFASHVLRFHGAVPLYTLENTAWLVVDGKTFAGESGDAEASSIPMTFQILDDGLFYVSLQGTTGATSADGDTASKVGDASESAHPHAATPNTRMTSAGIMMDAQTKSSALATVAGLEAIGCHGVVSVASIRGLAPSDPSFVVVHSSEWTLVPLAALMSRLERCTGGLCGPVGQVVVPQLFRLLLRVLTRLVARRFVQGNLAVLENWIVAVPSASVSTNALSGVQHCYYLFPAHWDASVDLTMLADSRVGVSVPVRVDFDAKMHAGQTATTIAREVGSCLYYFLEVLRWRSFLPTTTSSPQTPAAASVTPLSWKLLMALRNSSPVTSADSADESSSTVSKLAKSPKEILTVLHDAAHAVAAPPSNPESRRFLERLQAAPYKELRNKN